MNVRIDFRPLEIVHAISAVRKYLDLVEQQMPVVQACEVASLEAERPTGDDEAEYQAWHHELDYLNDMFDEDLIPTMRYSSIVFLHTVFETQLRAFCSAMQREKNIPVSLNDIGGSAIEKARIYLVKLASLRVAELDEWQDLRKFQQIRDCIVHHYGFISTNEPRHNYLRQIAASEPGLRISEKGRLLIERSVCEDHGFALSMFFCHLFEEAGWEAAGLS